MSVLERELLRAERDRQSVGLIMIDVDHFKKINDTPRARGRRCGAAHYRHWHCRHGATFDSVGRIGGEEFLIVAPNCDLGRAWELAERVRVHVASCSIMAGGFRSARQPQPGRGDERRLRQSWRSCYTQPTPPCTRPRMPDAIALSPALDALWLRARAVLRLPTATSGSDNNVPTQIAGVKTYLASLL